MSLLLASQKPNNCSKTLERSENIIFSKVFLAPNILAS